MTTPISLSSTWGDIQQTIQSYVAPFASNDAAVRESYNAKVTEAYVEFVRKAKEFHDNEQCFGEDLAREAFEIRNAIKEAHQAQTYWLGRAAIFVRNVFTYGSGNATFESLSKKKNPEELAYSAFRTDGRDLGLKGNELADVLGTWYAIKDVSTLYPEDITRAMVAAFKAQPLDNINPNPILAAYRPPATAKPVKLEQPRETVAERLVAQFMMKDEQEKAPAVLSKDALMATIKPAHHRDYASYM
ncbi:hypothetical protein [Bordetella sp. 15P40C-2]|uniref:hypothetical protein n=1 Tax=Bordetella sp. 15P40C-2 TaxID=2572246 RepID=UPI00132CB91B|nr:hypothetical protein [Bordetella sp. 15P40C-2]MVW71417.1 hypothetical protein [Bordetella sp. 15P40C-2]